jgi:hypothetical protein
MYPSTVKLCAVRAPWTAWVERATGPPGAASNARPTTTDAPRRSTATRRALCASTDAARTRGVPPTPMPASPHAVVTPPSTVVSRASPTPTARPVDSAWTMSACRAATPPTPARADVRVARACVSTCPATSPRAALAVSHAAPPTGCPCAEWGSAPWLPATTVSQTAPLPTAVKPRSATMTCTAVRAIPAANTGRAAETRPAYAPVDRSRQPATTAQTTTATDVSTAPTGIVPPWQRAVSDRGARPPSTRRGCSSCQRVSPPCW